MGNTFVLGAGGWGLALSMVAMDESGHGLVLLRGGGQPFAAA